MDLVRTVECEEQEKGKRQGNYIVPLADRGSRKYDE